MVTKDELPVCPVATTVQLIGSKWKLLIMRNLLARPWRFNELKKDFSASTHVCIVPSRYRLAYSSGLSIASAFNEHCEPGVVLSPSSGLLQSTRNIYPAYV